MNKHFTCSWCGRSMLLSNKSRHLSTCLYKNELKATKDYILKLIEDNPDERDQISVRKEKLELANVELMKVVEDVYLKFSDLRDKYLGGASEESAEEKIEGMNVCASTKYGYLVEWRKFKKWKEENSKTIGVASMNQYLQTLDCKSSTKWKKRNMLERILKTLVDPNMKLEPMRQRFSTQPKYSMTVEEIDEYLEEQKEVNKEDYLIQKMMITLSLRIGTIASLKLQNFDFYLMNDNNRLALPDTKSKRTNFREVNEDLQEEIRIFLDEINVNEEDYVFYRGGRDLNIARRSQALSNHINERIRKSKVFRQSSNFKYSSHMFRKCVPNLIFQKKVQEAKEEARKMLGHKRGSAAVYSYIDL
jgi:hypothetical protein